MRVFNWQIQKDNKASKIILSGKVVLLTILILSLNLFAQTKFDGGYKGYITGDLNGGIEFTINNDYYNNLEGEFWLSGEREHFKIIYGRVTDNGKVEAYLYDKKEYLTTSYYRGYFVGEFNGKWFSGTWTFDDTTSEKREASKGTWETTSSIEATHRKYSVKVLSGHAFVSQESKFSRENIVFKDDDIYEGKWAELHRGDTMKFEPFFVVRTPPESRVDVIDPNETTITFKSNTFAQFDNSGNIRISRGEAHFFIAKGSLNYEVMTPSGKLLILKTSTKTSPNINRYQFLPFTFSAGASISVAEFVVRVDSDGTTTCLVLNGAIDVSDSKKQKTVHLLQNQSSVIKIGSLPSTPTAFNQNTIDRWWEKTDSLAINSTNNLTNLKNLALHRSAQQSSTSQWSNPNDAQGAVNGIKNGSFGFHTNVEKNPWWQVDLGEIKQLSEIRIFNRLDYNPERARTIQVLLSNDGSNWTRVFTNNGNIFGGNDGKPLKISLTGKSARYVRLQLAETTYFHLDEVEIY